MFYPRRTGNVPALFLIQYSNSSIREDIKIGMSEPADQELLSRTVE